MSRNEGKNYLIESSKGYIKLAGDKDKLKKEIFSRVRCIYSYLPFAEFLIQFSRESPRLWLKNLIKRIHENRIYQKQSFFLVHPYRCELHTTITTKVANKHKTKNMHILSVIEYIDITSLLSYYVVLVSWTFTRKFNSMTNCFAIMVNRCYQYCCLYVYAYDWNISLIRFIPHEIN